MYKKITLKNGLRIITVPQQNSQAATILVLVGTGSKYETKETKGISHFLEHLYFKGTKKNPSALAVAEILDKLGGIYNAFTAEEYTGYYAKVAAVHFETALDWVSDIYLNSLLPEKEIKKERGVIIEEINMYSDTPMLYIGELWKNLLYGDQPAGWDIAGTKETVGRIARKQISDYMKSQYVASNTIVCAAGNISSSVVDQIKNRFSGIRPGKARLKQLVIDAAVGQAAKAVGRQTKPAVLVFPKNTDQTHLALGVRSFNVFHPQRFSQEILGIILGGMMSSRLFVEIREKLGLAYYVKTEVEGNPDTGFLMTRAGIDNQRVEKAIKAILKEYRKISQRKISLAELKKAKENFKGKLALYLESSDAKTSFYAGQEMLEGKILSPEEVFRRIDKITANDILKVAKEVFKPAGLNLALIGPFEKEEKFQKLLKL